MSINDLLDVARFENDTGEWTVESVESPDETG